MQSSANKVNSFSEGLYENFNQPTEQHAEELAKLEARHRDTMEKSLRFCHMHVEEYQCSSRFVGLLTCLMEKGMLNQGAAFSKIFCTCSGLFIFLRQTTFFDKIPLRWRLDNEILSSKEQFSILRDISLLYLTLVEVLLVEESLNLSKIYEHFHISKMKSLVRKIKDIKAKKFNAYIFWNEHVRDVLQRADGFGFPETVADAISAMLDEMRSVIHLVFSGMIEFDISIESDEDSNNFDEVVNDFLACELPGHSNPIDLAVADIMFQDELLDFSAEIIPPPPPPPIGESKHKKIKLSVDPIQ